MSEVNCLIPCSKTLNIIYSKIINWSNDLTNFITGQQNSHNLNSMEES